MISNREFSKEENLRYERKFVTKDVDEKEMEFLLKLNPILLSEKYTKRRVNNIYFDTPELKNYMENLAGNKERIKIRIRWYGPTFGSISKPVLEFKIKKQELNRKISFRLNRFTLSKKGSIKNIQDMLKISDLPEWVTSYLKETKPSLLNSYRRKYFSSPFNEVRVTLDSELSFYRLKGNRNSFKEKLEPSSMVVMEIKYPKNKDKIVEEMTQQLPFRLVANSKYIYGINILALVN